jgi:replicative DNA helicase
MSNVRTLADGYTQLHRMANDPTPRVPLGVPYLDARLNGGLSKGQCCMVMAFSHVGKTSLALNAIYQNVAVPILFFSIEMQFDQVASKLTAMATQRSTSQIESDFRGNIIPEYVQSMVDRHHLMLCDDAPDLNLKAADQSFEDASEALAKRGYGPPRLVIFDYLELISGNGMMEKSTQVDRAAERVHVFARKHKTSVMLLHQVGKGEAGGGAEPLDLGSGRYGGHQTMDVVVGMWNPSAKKDMRPEERAGIKDQRVLALLKNRVTGQTDLQGLAHRLDPVSMRLTEWSNTPQLPWQQQAEPSELEYA